MLSRMSAPAIIRRWLRRLGCATLLLILVVCALVLGALTPALYQRLVAFPAAEADWQALREARQPTELDTGYQDFKGVCHTHSLLSHDSEMPFEQILEAAHTADLSFVMLTDHCSGGKGDFSKQWSGMYEGVRFIRGFELSSGYLVWGLPEGSVLPCHLQPELLTRRVEELGGLLFFAHTEQPRPWGLPGVHGMEIYNIHTDLIDSYGDLPWLGPQILLTIGPWPDHAFRLLYDKQTAIVARWDAINQERPFVGIAANDAHQNVGIVLSYTEDERLRVRELAPGDEPEDIELSLLTRGLLRLFFGPLEPGRELWRLNLDPYPQSLRFVNTHLLATENTEAALLEALRAGRSYAAFNMIADAQGFAVVADNGAARATIGETLPWQAGTVLEIASPHVARLRILRDGEPMHEAEGHATRWSVSAPGRYRVEAAVYVGGEWVPWVYTNPIRVAAPAAAGA